MPLFASSAALRIVDSLAIVLSQAMQLARVRLASATSPVLRMMAERDHAVDELELLRREIDILRGQREAMSPHRRPDYNPQHRLAIASNHRLLPALLSWAQHAEQIAQPFDVHRCGAAEEGPLWTRCIDAVRDWTCTRRRWQRACGVSQRCPPHIPVPAVCPRGH